ncbi:MAG: phage/plasmid primase, P4 family [Syntrophus sp. (in: bacteria)]
MNHDGIPAEPKAMPSWCVWKKIDGRKIPYQFDGINKAKSNDSSTWTTFTRAYEAFTETDGAFDGICWMMPTKPNDIVFIDIDNCIKGGVVESYAQEIITRFNSYTERSQSGNGIHILIKAKKPIPKCRKKGSPYEIYDSVRACFLTGDVVDAHTTIEKRQEPLDRLFAEIFPAELERARNPQAPKTPPTHATLSDEALILKATLSKGGDKFKALWEGVTLGYYGDDSAADQALMNKLAFWTGKDAARMERLFSQSGLGKRDKWRDRSDYRERTIRKAIDDTTEVYEPRQESNDEAPIEDELTLNDVVDIKPPKNDNGEEYVTFNHSKATDAILKKLPVALSEDDQLYYWHSTTWQPNAESVIFNKVRTLAENRFNKREHTEIITALKHALVFNRVKFDPDPCLLGVKNGVVDLRTGTIRDYRPEDLITDQLEVMHDTAATCPGFIKFLEEVCPSPIDRLMLIDWFAIHAIRSMFPYVMFLNGLGRNGKGIYERVLKRFFGENAFSSMALEELTVKNNRFAGADLAGKRGQIVAEAGESHAKGKRTIPTAFLKNATGDGIIDSDQKNKGRIKFKPFYKATIDANDMPRIEDSSKGWIERFCKADMPHSFVDSPTTGTHERKKDPDLFEKLTTPEELSGILNLILTRTPDLIKTKIITKRPGKEMFAEYQKQSNSVSTFLETFCKFDPLKNIEPPIYLDTIFGKYQEWCDIHVADKVDDKRFGAAVKNFCNGINAKRVWDNDKRRKIYNGLSFEDNRYQSHLDHQWTINGPLESVTVPLGPLKEKNIWRTIKERFGYTSLSSTKRKTIDFSVNGTGSDHENSDGTDSDVNGPKMAINGTDNDSPTDREKVSKPDVDISKAKIEPPHGIGPNPRKDAPTPPTKKKPIVCAKCGADLTGKGQVEKSGKVYCARNGCGYPAREKA